ncbi:MAG: mandelate racemase [Planctomycetota bacterium]
MRLTELELRWTRCSTRLPFRFGRATMTAAPLLMARVGMDNGAATPYVGRSADLLVPKWFDKGADTTDEEDRAALIASARAAGEAWRTASQVHSSVFEQWLAVYRDRVEAAPLEAQDRLVRGFGVALVERAVIDAACRAAGVSFFEAWRRDLFGVRAGAAVPSLAGFDPARAFSRAPLSSVRVRHTVGMADELRAADVTAEQRGDDDHPCSLEEDIAAYGLDAFKLKVGGDEAADLARLEAIGAVLAERAPGALVTLDGNEQYADPGRLADVLERLGGRPHGAAILGHLAHIEQPAPRAATFREGTRAGLARLAAFAPVIIDEADLGLEAFQRAFDLGYRGTSVKNCKGVFRAVLNYGLAGQLGDGAFLAGEDLTNLPLLPLQQDLATAALLHLPHVERNGHHYFRGLGHLPPEAARAALDRHPDLYRATPEGTALRIAGGRVQVGSLDQVGYACGVEGAWLDAAPAAPL